MSAARLIEECVEVGEVKLAFAGLGLLPTDGDFERVRSQRIDCRPDHRQLRRPVAGIVGLRAQNQVGVAIDHQGVMATVTNNLRQGYIRSCGPA